MLLGKKLLEKNLIFSSDENAVFEVDGSEPSNVITNEVVETPIELGLDLTKSYAYHCERIECAAPGGFSDATVAISPLISNRFFTFLRPVIEDISLVIEPLYQELSDGGFYVYAYRIRLGFLWRQAGEPYSDYRLALMSLPRRMDLRIHFRGDLFMEMKNATMLHQYSGLSPVERIEFASIFVFNKDGSLTFVDGSKVDLLKQRNPVQGIASGALHQLDIIGEKSVWYEHWKPSSRYFTDSEGVIHTRESGRRMVISGEFGSILDTREVLNMRVCRWFLEWLYADDRDRWIRLWDFQGEGNRGFVNVSVREYEFKTIETFIKTVRMEVVERVPRGTIPISVVSQGVQSVQSQD